MRQLKFLVLLMASVAFMATSCAKKPTPPELGDHTVYPDDDNNNDDDDDTPEANVVLSLGSSWGDIFSAGPNGILYVRNGASIFKVYKPDDKGVFDAGTSFPGAPWFASANLYYMGVAQGVETVMVTNEPPDAGLFRFDLNLETGFLSVHPTTNTADPFPDNFGFWYGDGWDNWDIIPVDGKWVFQIKHNEDNKLYRSDFVEFTDDWSTWNRPGTLIRDDMGETLGNYISAMAMGGNLLIVNAGGDLIKMSLDEDGKITGSTKIGEGWDIYDRIVASGNDLLALNSKGDVHRYTIDLSATDNNAIQ